MHLKGVIVRRADGSLPHGCRGVSATFGSLFVHVGMLDQENEIELPLFLNFILSKLKRTVVFFLWWHLLINAVN